MKNIAEQYTFPVKDRLDAREVFEPDFDIRGKEDELYVDLSEVRSTEYLTEIKAQLNLDDDYNLSRPVRQHAKILFSGYKGSGKTLEVRKLHKQLNKPEAYLSILVETEREIEISKFKAEFFYVLLIAKLVQRLVEEKIPFHSIALADLQKEWLSEKEITNEINSSDKTEVEGTAGIGGDFFGFFKLGKNFKALFANETKTVETLKRKVLSNTPELIERFNLVLMEVREALRVHTGVAKDIVFIFDGSEKMRDDIYEQLFIQNAKLINDIQLCIIASVPIRTFFEVTHMRALQDFYDAKLLPILKPSPEVHQKMEEILRKRADVTAFMNPDALSFVIEKSGGSIRQMLKLMSMAIISSREIITAEIMREKAFKKMRSQMYETLTTEHKEILQQRKYIDEKQQPNVADKAIWQLVEAMILLKYNGTIAVNPLIAEYFTD